MIGILGVFSLLGSPEPPTPLDAGRLCVASKKEINHTHRQ
jgi:hypothetical protein